ncbi:MAG: SNF2-related protein [Bacillota bacterium]
MTSGDVLAVAFPRIDPALLWSAGSAARHYARPVFASPPPRYLHRTLHLPGRATVELELFGPPRSRWLQALLHAHRNPAEAARRFELALEGLRLSPLPHPDRLLTPEFLRTRWEQAGVIPYRHQLAAARRVIFELGGRAVLADEVGLGKTIESGLVLHELLLRRLVLRTLILVPSGLCWQWYRELRDKFDLPVELQASERDWGRVPLLVASLDTAKRSPHREEVLANPYDLVIVDEAHRLKNDRTQAYALVSAIRTRYLLLVTATPVHNHVRELWSLVKLVAPTQALPAPPRARSALAGHPAAGRLREAVHFVMIRTRRADTPVPFTGRHVHTIAVHPTPPEQALYSALDEHLLRAARASGRVDHRTLVFLTLKRELCSSPHALAESLRRMVRRGRPELEELLAKASRLSTWAKADACARLVRRLGDDHVLLFTEYVATQRALADRLAALGRPVVLFHGGLTPMQRDWARGVFERTAPVMVSTDAGAEGVNLQFCRNVVNVDLPWNPMRIEQRIGRLHRLGQTRDVHVWNLIARGTVEEYVLYLLHQKLDLFRHFIGQIDAIVEHLGSLSRLEQQLTRLFARSEQSDMTGEQIRQALHQLAQEWQQLLENLKGNARRTSPDGRH